MNTDTEQFKGHTPGPWSGGGVGVMRPYHVAVVRPEHRAHGVHYISAGEPAGGQGWPDGNAPPTLCAEAFRANARLIAAAPELLKERDELQTVLEKVENHLAEGALESRVSRAIEHFKSAYQTIYEALEKWKKEA